MTEIGKYNRLKVVKHVDFGVYLDGGNNVEILLPKKYIHTILHEGDYIDVFIYTDSDDRLIATTESPLACVGEFAFLKVKQVNNIGAFLDWGLAKDILVPFREQRVTMKEGGQYLVYVYLDHNTKRIVASSKVEKFLGNTIPEYKRGEQINALVYQRTDIGYKAIVNNLHNGMLYHNELYEDLSIGDLVKAYVKTIRPDGKIDLRMSDIAQNRTTTLADQIYDWLVISGGESNLGDKSSPEEIKKIFHCSKKDFKRALGQLYKERKIEISQDGMKIV